MWRCIPGAVAIVALLVAGSLVGQSCAPAMSEQANSVERPPRAPEYDTTPVRGALRPLGLDFDGDIIACSFCHDGFTGELSGAALEGQHQNIVFDHGLNLRCLNCHNPEDPDTYIAHDGTVIPGDDPVQLCSKCHGTHYREWTLGAHGRVNGYWDEALGPRVRLACTRCHDPHRPRFPDMSPEPPPPLTRFEHPATTGGEDHE